MYQIFFILWENQLLVSSLVLDNRRRVGPSNSARKKAASAAARQSPFMGVVGAQVSSDVDKGIISLHCGKGSSSIQESRRVKTRLDRSFPTQMCTLEPKTGLFVSLFGRMHRHFAVALVNLKRSHFGE